MRAVILEEFGGPEVLKIAEVPQPEPVPTEVLVRVHAAGVNPVDWKTRTGRGAAGAMGPLPLTLGWDVSGVVEQTGYGVTRFQVGDEVFGMPRFPAAGGRVRGVPDRAGAAARAQAGERRPQRGGGCPLASLTAWQAIVETAKLEAGQRILIHGAAGGVGHLAVQIAKSRGAFVVGTAKAAQHEFLRGLGADELIDYTATRFEDEVARPRRRVRPDRRRDEPALGLDAPAAAAC